MREHTSFGTARDWGSLVTSARGWAPWHKGPTSSWCVKWSRLWQSGCKVASLVTWKPKSLLYSKGGDFVTYCIFVWEHSEERIVAACVFDFIYCKNITLSTMYQPSCHLSCWLLWCSVLSNVVVSTMCPSSWACGSVQWVLNLCLSKSIPTTELCTYILSLTRKPIDNIL